jgi:hypothetical protein
MTFAVERIVVQTTAEDKERIAVKARKLSLPVSELMRRGAFAYQAKEADAELGALAHAAKQAADRAGAAIDEALAFIEASNRRIDRLEKKAAPSAPRKAAR